MLYNQNLFKKIQIQMPLEGLWHFIVIEKVFMNHQQVKHDWELNYQQLHSQEQCHQRQEDNRIKNWN